MVCYKTLLTDKKIQLDILKCAKSLVKEFSLKKYLTLFHPGFLVPVFSRVGVPCHKSSLANALIMKLGQLVDQVKWGLQVYSLLP